ncbi:MAG TPA: LysM peptidoglycan-binding domain-containing protein [Lamprocystis sp. (in: g-proteobacteria)]|nr:LysM peptidoglycan-binding domain-containing protein [Lamprocystis sp. (in: g-proteobacteria)]
MSAIQRQDRPNRGGLSHAAARRGRLAAGLILLALSLGAPQVRAADAPPAAAAVPSAPPTQAELAAQVVELTEHIHGMEGKLKESAAARKTADQARMEAERRLAEGTQETGRLSAEIGLLREAKAALEARLAHAEDQNTRGAEQLAAQEERVRRLTAEGEAQTRRTEGLEHQLELLKEAQRLADEAHQGVVHDAQTTDAVPTAAKADRATLEGELPSASAQRPYTEGGTVAVPEVQAQPVAAARAAGARNLYRVRPSDTLARIGRRFYGDHSQWRAIYEANRAVLPDPDRLTPGMTLVIP